MDSYKNADGTLTPLIHKNIDTGMGFERLMTILQNTPSAYETDLFGGIIHTIEKLTHTIYDPHSDTPTQKSLRIIADHARSCTFLAMDGVSPSNEGRGYIIRRLLRRMWFHLLLVTQHHTLDASECATKLITSVTTIYHNHYPHLLETQTETTNMRSKEWIQFSKTIAR
jgi:alanyl-tRNA synthetase